MSLLQRRTLFRRVEVDENLELDYLDTSLITLELTTTRQFTVTAGFAHRIDLIAYREMGSFNLGWLIAWHNGIKDPVAEIVPGKVLNIPSIEEFYRFMNRNRRSRDNG